MNKKTNAHLPGNRLFAAGLHWVPERDLGVRNYKVAAQVFQHPLSQIFYMGFQNIAIDGKKRLMARMRGTQTPNFSRAGIQ
jgi:hypothetical protein